MQPSTSPAFTVQDTLTTSIGSGTWLTGVGLVGMTIQRNDTVTPSVTGSAVSCAFMSGSTTVSFQSTALAGAQPNSCSVSTQGSGVHIRLQLAGSMTLPSTESVTVNVPQGLLVVPSSTGTRGVEAYSSSSGSYVDQGTTSYTVATQSSAPPAPPGNDDIASATVLQTGTTSIAATAGTTYYVQVSAYNASSMGVFTIR